MQFDQDWIEPPLTKVQWLLGNVCNYACWYCPEHLRQGDTAWDGQDSLANAVSQLSAEIRMSGRKPVFEFQGGEPTLHDGIVKGLSSTGGNAPGGNRLVTNGSASIEWWKDNSVFFDDIEISYHTAYADRKHIERVCEFLLNQEEPPRVSIKVHATNEDAQWSKAYDVFEILQEKQLPVELKLLYSNFTQGNTFMPYKTYQLKQYYESRGEAFDPAATEFVDQSGYIPRGRRRHVIDESVQKSAEFEFKGMNCWSGIEQLVVFPDGAVYRGWCRASGSLGNLIAGTFEMPAEPIQCPLAKCRNGFDRQSAKL